MFVGLLWRELHSSSTWWCNTQLVWAANHKYLNQICLSWCKYVKQTKMCLVAGAFGYFEVTHDITRYCKAKVFEHVGKTTPIAADHHTQTWQKLTGTPLTRIYSLSFSHLDLLQSDLHSLTEAQKTHCSAALPPLNLPCHDPQRSQPSYQTKKNN